MCGGALIFRCSTGQAYLWFDHNVQPHKVIVRVIWYDPYFSAACRERDVVALQNNQVLDFCTVKSIPDRHSLCVSKQASTCQVGPSYARSTGNKPRRKAIKLERLTVDRSHATLPTTTLTFAESGMSWEKGSANDSELNDSRTQVNRASPWAVALRQQR